MTPATTGSQAASQPATQPAPKAGGPDFSQPIAALKHCHDRIRRELHALDELHAHLRMHGVDAAACDRAAAIVKYFNNAAPIHHADEEEDLLPMLQQSATGADAALLKLMLPTLMQEHREMASTWTNLMSQLQEIEAGGAAAPATLDLGLIKHFSMLYAAHMDTEETHIATMARRLFDASRMHLLGNAMLARRGLPPLPALPPAASPTGASA